MDLKKIKKNYLKSYIKKKLFEKFKKNDLKSIFNYITII